MWRFGRYSERKKRKSPFSTTPLSFVPCPGKFRGSRRNGIWACSLVLVLLWKVRLINVARDSSLVKPAGTLVPVYTRDELLYNRLCDEVLSLTLNNQQTRASEYRLIVCSSNEAAPMLVNIVSSLSVLMLYRPSNANVGMTADQYVHWLFVIYHFISAEEGGYVFTSVSRITLKVVNGFWRNFLEG